jgi:enoyl-CoA hydratase
MGDSDQPRVRRDDPAGGVARIVLTRAHKRNAQDPPLLFQLDAAFSEAAQDDAVKVIILAAEGPDFSAGHDLDSGLAMPCAPVATLQSAFNAPGIEGHLAFEQEAYLGLCRRWRDLPKPTIAQVQGRCIAAGLMLIWPLDLIVASRSASFSDPVAALGTNGVEYFLHPWEFGPRRAKELLFTGDAISAEEAASIGMVNHVYSDDDLEDQTLALAERIATRPAFGLRLAKQSVNAALEAQGQTTAVDVAFGLHHVGHGNNIARFDSVIDPNGVPIVREGLKIGRLRKPRS